MTDSKECAYAGIVRTARDMDANKRTLEVRSATIRSSAGCLYDAVTSIYSPADLPLQAAIIGYLDTHVSEDGGVKLTVRAGASPAGRLVNGGFGDPCVLKRRG